MKSIKSVFYILFLMLGFSSCLDNDELPNLADRKFVRIKEDVLTVTIGEKYIVTCAYDSEETAGRKFNWTILDTSIATIETRQDGSAVVAGVGEGQTTVQVQSEDGKLKYFSTLNVMKDRSIKILAIGNALSEDAVENYLFDLANAAGYKVIIGNLYLSDASLETHWQNASNKNAAYELRKTGTSGGKNNEYGISISQAINNENWDYICFQESSSLSGVADGYQQYLPRLIEYIQPLATNPDVRYALHQTWAYAKTSNAPGFALYDNDQAKMYQSIVDAVSKAKSIAGIDLVIPAGTAVQNGRTTYIGEKITRDGIHLNLHLGRFIAASTWYEAIFGGLQENNFMPAELSVYDTNLAKATVRAAVGQPEQVTVMTEYEFPEPNDFVLQYPVYIDFGPLFTEAPYNVYARPTDGKLLDLKDEQGSNTGFAIHVDKPFTDVIEWDIPNGFNLPWTVSNDMFFGDGIYIPESSLVLSNLNRNETYTLVIYGSIGVTDTETDYHVEGKNEKMVRINTAFNYSTLAVFEGIIPADDATVTITVKPGPNNAFWSKFYNINVMYITPEGYPLFP